MPESWWGKTILAVYLGGYCYRIIDFGLATWRDAPFFDWWQMMGFQAMAQSFWPLWVALHYFEVGIPAWL